MKFYLISPQQGASEAFERFSVNEKIARVSSAAIATVAALAPPDIEIILCDELLDAINFDTDADFIGITANSSQVSRALKIAEEFQQRQKHVVIGGPHISLQPADFHESADTIVLGEFEPIAADFFADMRTGKLQRKYHGRQADMTTSPVPRWELYSNDRIMAGVVQTSRGCPFDCNFCDVIQYVGRAQRHKNNAQVIAEIQKLYELGYGHIMLADDNFTAYRKRTRSLLSEIIRWNGAEGRDYIQFSTQLSIDIAKDDEILELCHQAGLLDVFIGIETSDPQGLKESNKRMNLHLDLAEQCRKIVRKGIKIEPGLIVGFDSDDLTAFQRQYEFGMSLPCATFKVSLLSAPVTTPLFKMMQQQNRIENNAGKIQVASANYRTNIIPAQMSRSDLYVGVRWLISKLFKPESFVTRLNAIAEMVAPPPWIGRGDARRRPVRPVISRFSAKVVRNLITWEPAMLGAIKHATSLTEKYPDRQSSINDALMHYLLYMDTQRISDMYSPTWAKLDSPPFGQTDWNGITVDI